MGKKLSAWKTKGMNRDLSVSAFNPEFAFENMNLRLATNENNTVMSWVNEKGPAAIGVSVIHAGKEGNDTVILGTCIGTAVLNNYLVLFTTDTDKTKTPYVQVDRIYRLEYAQNDKTQFSGIVLYEGNLGFNKDYPLETLVSYESEHIQKVYWTDGINQPRLINIAPQYNDSGTEIAPSYTDTSFDFVPTLQLDETVSVKKITGGGGMFAPGVIQYSFTYYNKHGQESNIFYTTPLYYISYADRGASPEDKVDNTFKITVNNLDTNFDYLRIYSIQRTSINSTPICKRIQDIEIVAGMTSASYTDTGMSGDSIDPTELLYKGGSGVHVGTMDQKDNTLFMGDLTVLNTAPPELTEKDKADILASVNEVRTFYVDIESSDNYVYGNQLTAMNSDDDSTSVSVPCAGFKHDDWYRLGVQFQDEFGRWTDPIFLDDIQVGNTPSSLVVESSGGGGGGGEEYGDKDLPLMVAFENKATDETTGIPQWITIDNIVDMVIKNPESGATETVSVNLGSTDKIQISGGNYVYFPNAFVANGSQYKGWHLAEGQNCIVKDGEGNATHTVDPLDTSLVLSMDNEILITCESTTHPDVDPTPEPGPEPEPPVWVKDFEDLVKEFNKVLSTPVTENSSTWNYLLAAYNMAKDEWDSDSIGLFNIVRDSSVEIYNYRGTDVTYAQQAQESLYSWLMAMCLAELVPSNSEDGKTNKQTQLYQKAYDLGGGRSIPIYGNFDAKGDVMLARLVAAGIYAINRSNYSFSDMDSMRREIGGSTFNISNWNNGAMGYTGVSSIGYSIAANEIFPSAPGPFVDAYSSKTPPSEQPSDLFYSRSGNPHTWYNSNYKVDVAIDEWVTGHYNLEAVDSYLERTVQAVADDSESTKHQLAEKVYYAYDTGGTTRVSEKDVPNPRFTFKPAIEDSSSTKFFKGTFNSEVTGVDLSDKLTDSTGNETILKTFMDGVRNTGSKGRQQLYDAQIGRRRPATGSAVNLSRISQEEDRSNEYRKNWLDDSSIVRLVGSGTRYDSSGTAHSWYVDMNGNGKWDAASGTDPYEPYVDEPWTYSGGDNLYPDPKTYTYPSGHSAGVFGQAVMLTQILPDRAYEIFKAAYKFSVSRTIVRAHWNSDVMYGRVIGTMMIPVLNAVQSFQTDYNSAYEIITGDVPPTPPTPGEGIRYVITNNTGYEARFTGAVVLNLSRDPSDWSNNEQAYAHMHAPTVGSSYAYNDIIIPPGGTYTSPEVTEITGIYHPTIDFLDGTWYIMNNDNGSYGHTIFLYTREYSKSRKEYSGSQHMFWIEPLQNAKLVKGQTYYLDLRYTTLNPLYADPKKLAILADASTTKNYVDDLDDEVYGYAILAEGKTTLVEE